MIKKITCLFLALGVSSLQAKPIVPSAAKKVAEGFYKQHAKTDITSISLAYTETSASGVPLFYAFNINSQDGFVLVSADDVTKPIIGYSTEKQFVIPEANTTIGHWLKDCASGINTMRSKKTLPDAKVAIEWVKYSTNNANLKHSANSTLSNNSVLPLVKTTWNQSPYYNALCPGGSVTGCVATAMAQIMRYWNYPAHGTGSSSYNAGSYGTLSCNYGATTYNWANMPLYISSANNDVAVLNYQCGVSVEMEYSPSGSGAWVITGDNPVCAQTSYVTYFGYDPNTIQGVYRSSYDDSTWIAMLKGDLDIGRPVQYVGDDPAEGGHTWVCDGYDQNNNFHMNWGWGGADNGYYAIDNLNTGGFNPSEGHEAVFGIVPIAANPVDAGVETIAAPSGFYCGTSGTFTPTITLHNYGSSNLTACDINYQIDNGSIQTQSWTGNLVSGQAITLNLASFTSTVGSHTLKCYTGNPNGVTDQNAVNDQSAVTFNITSGASLPVVEGFENYVLPSSIWSVSHTFGNGADFVVTSNSAATGSKSAMVDNMNNVAGNNSVLQTSSTYDMTNLASPALSFKVAYQAKASNNNDKLQVFTSTDCGASWQSRWARWSPILSTLGGIGTAAYTPSANEFTTYTVNINALASSQHVMFKWEFFADPNGAGNNLYIDDINIVNATAAGIENIETAVGLLVYPNPSNGKLTVAFGLSQKQVVAVQVSDMLGRVVENIEEKTYQAGDNSIVLGAQNTYPSGVYFANITINGQQITKKIIVE